MYMLSYLAVHVIISYSTCTCNPILQYKYMLSYPIVHVHVHVVLCYPILQYMYMLSYPIVHVHVHVILSCSTCTCYHIL